LIQTGKLSATLEEAILDAEREGFFTQGPEEVLDFCCRALHGYFGVSRQAMETRIRKSEFWPHPKVPPAPN
jgi:hypothetical protein